MHLTITINMDNAAFFDDREEPHRNAEVSRILHTFAERLNRAWELEAGHGFVLMDTNGNRVGNVEIIEDVPATP